MGRTCQGPVGRTGESIGMLGKSHLGLAFGFTVCRCQLILLQWLSASLVLKCCKRCWKDFVGRASGLTWTHGLLCVCAHHPASGTSRGSTSRTASSFSFSSKRSPLLSRRYCSLSLLFLRRRSRHVLRLVYTLMAAGVDSGTLILMRGDSRTQLSEVPSVERRCALGNKIITKQNS